MGTSRADKYTGVRKTTLYSDFTVDLFPHPDTKQLTLLKNQNAIDSALRNLALTNKYERFHNPRVGGNMKNQLFNNILPTTQKAIENSLKEMIRNYEPRAVAINVIASPTPDEEGYNVAVEYYERNSSVPVTTTIYLERIR